MLRALLLSVCLALPLFSAVARAQGSDPLLEPGARCIESVAEVPTEEVEVFDTRSAPTARRFATYALMALVLLAAFVSLDRATPRVGAPDATRRPLVRGLLLALAAAALFASFMPTLPVHDHDAFVARAECAMDPACDADRPGWMPPAYHAYGLLLSAAPYRHPWVEFVGLGLTLGALALFALALARMHRLFGAPRRGLYVALVAATMVALHPVSARLSVAGTFWPWADLCLFGSAWLALWAAERRCAWGYLAAAGAFALALTSSVAFLALAPLAVIAPWAWSRRAPRLLALVFVLVVATLVCPYAWLTLRELGPSAAARPWASALAMVPTNLVYLDPRLTPAPLGLCFLLGLGVVMRRWRRSLPWLLAFALTEAQLGSLQDLSTGYPVRLIHATTSMYFSAWLASEGAVVAVAWLAHHMGRSRRTWAVALAASAALTLPLCHEAGAFAWGPRVLGPERRAFSRALDALPPHDLIVAPTSIMQPLRGVELGGDPIEARYPWGEYRARRLAAGEPVAPVVSLPDYLRRPDDFRGLHALLYVGASLRSFEPAEIGAGLVHPPFARPGLCALLRDHVIEPAAVFELPTANHPDSLTRLTADRMRHATLGFFWIHPRAEARP